MTTGRSPNQLVIMLDGQRHDDWRRFTDALVGPNDWKTTERWFKKHYDAQVTSTNMKIKNRRRPAILIDFPDQESKVRWVLTYF